MTEIIAELEKKILYDNNSDVQLKKILTEECYKRRDMGHMAEDLNLTFNFVIEKMNQIPCPIWEHRASMIHSYNLILTQIFKPYSKNNMQQRYYTMQVEASLFPIVFGTKWIWPNLDCKMIKSLLWLQVVICNRYICQLFLIKLVL